MSPGRPAWKKIVARFGRELVGPDRAIRRDRLAHLLFSDPRAKRYVDRLVHPLVMAEKKRTVARLEREGRVAIFVSEAALTIEAGYARFFDRIVVVHCPPRVQVQRLMARDGLGPGEARRRIRSQMPAREKLAHADYVIDASGSLAETVEQAERVYAALFQDSELARLAWKAATARAKKKPAGRRGARP
jgi:dephospho-CoA kinase